MLYKPSSKNVYFDYMNYKIFVSQPMTFKALYSYACKLWKEDDILIQYEFPFEEIDDDVYEIGGGTAHANWCYINFDAANNVIAEQWAWRNKELDWLFVSSYLKHNYE